jgi:hypothetical protein
MPRLISRYMVVGCTRNISATSVMVKTLEGLVGMVLEERLPDLDLYSTWYRENLRGSLKIDAEWSASSSSVTTIGTASAIRSLANLARIRF